MAGKLLLAVVAACLVAAAVADPPEDLNNLQDFVTSHGGTDAPADLQAVLSTEPDFVKLPAEAAPMEPITPDSPECEKCKETTLDASAGDAAANMDIQAQNQISGELMEEEKKLREAQKCVEEAKATADKYEELKKRRDALGANVKKYNLELKLQSNTNALGHVSKMYDILKYKLGELTRAQADMEEKKAMTEEALKTPPPAGEPPKPDPNAYKPAVLGEEIKAIHDNMVKSLDASTKRQVDLVKMVPELHDFKYAYQEEYLAANKVANVGKDQQEMFDAFKGVAAKALARKAKAEEMAAAAAAKKAELTGDAAGSAKGSAAGSAKGSGSGSGKGLLLELESEKAHLKAEEQQDELINLRSSILKLQKHLRNKRRKHRS